VKQVRCWRLLIYHKQVQENALRLILALQIEPARRRWI